MQSNQQTQNYQKLSKVILTLFEHPEYAYANPEELQKIFFENLNETLLIAYDISLSIEKLQKRTKDRNGQIDFDGIAEFLIETLETEKTYTLLNYYLFNFIKAYLAIVKDEHEDKVEKLILNQGIEKKDIDFLLEEYSNLIAQYKNTPPPNYPAA